MGCVLEAACSIMECLGLVLVLALVVALGRMAP